MNRSRACLSHYYGSYFSRRILELKVVSPDDVELFSLKREEGVY